MNSLSSVTLAGSCPSTAVSRLLPSPCLPVRNDGEPTYLRHGRCTLAHPHAKGGHEAAGLVPPADGEYFTVTELRRQLPQWWKVHVAVRLRLGDVRRPLQGQHLSDILGAQHEWLFHGEI